MRESRKKELIIYRLGDYISALLSWFIFFIFRKTIEKPDTTFDIIIKDINLWYGLALIPLIWITIYSIFDKYRDIYRYSRLETLKTTLFTSFLGSLILFFVILIDDYVLDYVSHLYLFMVLFFTHFFITSTVRMIILTKASKRLKSGKVKYNTLIIGGDKKRGDLYEKNNQSIEGNINR